jgi:hypothetical protein
LLLPEESYVAEAAYKALENFSAEEVSACYHLLQRHHLVVKRRTESSRPFGIASRLTHSLSLNCLIFEDFVSEYKVLRKSFDDAMMRDEGMSFEAGQNGAANAVALTALMLGKVHLSDARFLSASKTLVSDPSFCLGCGRRKCS